MVNELTVIFVVSGIIWTVIAIIIGRIGASREIGFVGAFYASLFLSPILAMLFILASDKKNTSEITENDILAIYIPYTIICIFIFIVKFS